MTDPTTFLSGETGHVAGVRRTLARRTGDTAFDLWLRARRTGARLDRLAAEAPPRDVLVLGIYRPRTASLEAAVSELRQSRHSVTIRLGATAEPLPGLAADTVASGLAGGKFQNLNELLGSNGAGSGGSGSGGAGSDPAPFDPAPVDATPTDPAPTDPAPIDPRWVLVVDDDVALPPRFLDRFVGVCEAFGFALAQPAQTLMSHAAWRVTRRRFGSLARETRFVEIGPVTAFRADAAGELMPFPDLRFGWGLDLHWAALAEERGWRMGIVDALPVRHETAPVAAAYPHEDAIAEAQRFLAERPYVHSEQAQETLAVHR